MATSFLVRPLAATAVGVLIAGCGGGGDHSESTSRPEAAAFSTLLDDDGGVLPADPRALPAAGVPVIHGRRYATAAQAADLQRMGGYDVRRIEVACCGDAAVARALDAVAGGSAGLPYAVFVSGTDGQVGAAVVERLVAGGLDRVWWVSP
jgi:hypothetical protein